MMEKEELYHLMEQLLQVTYGLQAENKLLHRLEKVYPEEEFSEELALCFVMSTCNSQILEALTNIIHGLDEKILSMKKTD